MVKLLLLSSDRDVVKSKCINLRNKGLLYLYQCQSALVCCFCIFLLITFSALSVCFVLHQSLFHSFVFQMKTVFVIIPQMHSLNICSQNYTVYQ